MSVVDIILITLSVIGAIRLLISLVKSLKEKDFGLDILALIAIISTLLVHEYIASFVVVLMTLTGDFLEEYAAKKAASRLDSLFKSVPQTAHLVNQSDFESSSVNPKHTDIDINSVQIGNLIKVLPSEVIPVDGVLLTEAVVDESSITGESLPINKNVGEEVLSGSVVISSTIHLKTTAIASDSQYQNIVKLVEAARGEKSHTVKLASIVSIPFTIISLIIASLAWAISKDPLRFAEVLVLATPCPLLIAAPVAFIGGVSRCAKNGIIIKSPVILEVISKAKVCAFDKTGTLTKGKPFVVDFQYSKSETYSKERVLELGSLIEKNSKHVFADAICQYYENFNILHATNDEFEKYLEVPGKGIEVSLKSGDIIRVGNLHFAGSDDPFISINHDESAVYISISGQILGRWVLKDEIREESYPLIKHLEKLGILHIVMLTGDKRTVAKQVASELKIDDVRSELLPEQKLESVLGLKMSCKIHQDKHAGSAVMMVGDGVNDAPVLAGADVGVALSAKGKVAASESADVVIMKDDVMCVSDLIQISDDTMNIAKQSMVGGISLAVSLMLVAAFGFIPATFGAILQELIDFLAIANGVRAAYKKRLR